MKTMMGIFLACLCVTLIGCQGQKEAPQNSPLPVPPEYVKLEVFGKLTIRMQAIGDGRTEFLITAKGQTWELDFYKDDNLILRAKELDGQHVWVRGTPELRPRVEEGMVPTILVDDLKNIHMLLKKQS